MREVEREGQRENKGERERSTGTKKGREGRGMGIERRGR